MSPEPFDVGSDRVDGVDVIAIAGELDMNTAADLRETLEAALAKQGPLLIDLSSCEFIDSTGIALIVRAWQQLGDGAADGTRFALCGLNDQVSRVLELTGLKASIPTHPSRAAALEALRGRS